MLTFSLLTLIPLFILCITSSVLLRFFWLFQLDVHLCLLVKILYITAPMLSYISPKSHLCLTPTTRAIRVSPRGDCLSLSNFFTKSLKIQFQYFILALLNISQNGIWNKMNLCGLELSSNSHVSYCHKVVDHDENFWNHFLALLIPDDKATIPC